MYLDYRERRRYAENLGKKWRQQVKNSSDIVFGSTDASTVIFAVKSYIDFLESKKEDLDWMIRDRKKSIDETIGYEKEFIKRIQDDPDYLKS
jgi:ASC-1-like (ASCH) protein